MTVPVRGSRCYRTVRFKNLYLKRGVDTCLNSIDIAQKQDIEVKNVKSTVIAKRDTVYGCNVDLG